MRRVVIWAWLVVLLLFVVLEVPMDLLGLPSPALFAGLLAGLIYALAAREPMQMPGVATRLAQAMLGSAIGVLISVDTLRQLSRDWAPVLLVCLATLALSVAAGFVLRLHRDVSPATAAFSMVAGGASGIVAIARDLGADDRIVAVVQYLRVLVIIVSMPLVTRLVFDAVPMTAGGGMAGGADAPGGAVAARGGMASGGALAAGGAGASDVWARSWWAGVLFTVVCVGAGLLLTRVVSVPAGSLLLPLLVGVAISLTGLLHGITVPGLVQNAAFAIIGVQVGLRFTRASLRSVATLLPLALVTIAGLIVASALLGLVLARTTGHTDLDGYLATTPGGLYAVLATAIGSGSDVTFVLTVQIVRLFVMLFSAPLLARWLHQRA